jgi:hypothetical protein
MIDVRDALALRLVESLGHGVEWTEISKIEHENGADGVRKLPERSP